MQTVRRSLDAMLAWLALTLVGGCGAHSPYDASWVSSEIAKSAGHDVPVRDVSTEGARVRPSLPPAVANTAALSEDEAVSVALWNSAPLRADLTQLGFARADLDDAAAIPNPNLSFLLPMSTRQVELSVLYPMSTLLQRPWRIASAKYDVERTARSLVQNGLDVIRDVRLAWADLEASERRKKLRERIDRLMRESAAIALRRFESGDTSLLEADLVKAESLAATELAERAAREEKLARVRLRLVLGLAESALGADIATRTTEPLPTASPALVELERAALGSRPDVRAAEMGIEAASERLGLERARILQLLARLDAKPVGPAGGYPLVAQPGLTLELPIFSQNPGGRARAHAEIERAAWTYLAVRQQVVTDVRMALGELEMAMKSRAPWTTTIVPLQERNVAAAMQAYQAGEQAYLVVIEATRRLVDAEIRELDLGLDVRRARARLDRAVGWRIDASR